MPPLPRHLLCLLATLAAASAVAAADARYRPLLQPRFTAGQTFGYSADADYNSLIVSVEHQNGVNTDTGDPIKAEKYFANIHTRFEVKFVAETALARQVFKNGSLSEAVFQVSLCQVMDEKNGLQTLIPQGAILTARKEKDGQVAFAINGVAPNPQLAAQLSVLIAMGNEQSTNNELLGPPQPESVGATWPINLKAVLNSDLPQCFPGLNGVVGNVSLESVQTDKAGAPRGVINAAYSLVGVKPPFGPDFRPEPSTVNFKVYTTSPVSGGPGQYDMKLTSLVHHAGHTGNSKIGFAGTEAEFTVSIDQNIHFKTDSQAPVPASLASAPAAPDAPPVPPGLSAANIYRPPPLWAQNQSQTAGPEKHSASTPTTSTAPVAPQAKPAAATTPFVMPTNIPSPFDNAQSPLAVPAPPPNSK